jgi:hypothetical protein
MTYVVNELDSLFTNNVTIRIDVAWGEHGPSDNPTSLTGSSAPHGASTTTYVDYLSTYTDLRNALINAANASGNPAQLAAVKSLPMTDPTGGSGFFIASAEAKALNMSLGSDFSGVDGYIGFGSSFNWSYTPGVAPPAGASYFIGVAEHEITEVMGRVAIVGTKSSAYTVMDLFRYTGTPTGPHQRDLTADPPNQNFQAYFSYDGGVTNLGNWNNLATNGFDLGDWFGGPSPNDAFNTSPSAGLVNPLTTTDITLMNVLGWDTAYPPNEIPNGVTDYVSSFSVDDCPVRRVPGGGKGRIGN